MTDTKRSSTRKTSATKATGKKKSVQKKHAVKKKSESRSRSRKPRYTSATADKHELYQHSVQDPDVEIAFVSRVYKRIYGRVPLSLREDFCGTALFCAHWIQSRSDRTAVGIDLDQPTLDWGIERNLAPIGEPGARIQLLNQNVLDPLPESFDLAVGLNFSYWIFKKRVDMLAYFKGVHESLGKEGLLVLDAYGGPMSMEAMEPEDVERTAVDAGFTYLWDQHSVNAVDHSIVNYIHFEFKDGTKLRRAFTYEWRFWTLPELCDILKEAGFSKTTVFWEDEDDEGEGTGVYRARKRADNGGAWVSYLVAER